MKRTALLYFGLLSIVLAACGAQTSAQPDVQLQPTMLQSLTTSYQFFTFDMCSDAGPQGFEALPAQGTVLAGEQAQTSYSSLGRECSITDFIYYAGMLFDLSQFGGHPISHATLSFRLVSSETAQPQERTSCASQLTLADTAWKDYDVGEINLNLPSISLPIVDFASAPQSSPTPGIRLDPAHATLSVDVTEAVNGWLSKRWPNQGLLLSKSPGDTVSCLSRYTDFTLKISR